jgi:5-methylthioribose kinase
MSDPNHLVPRHESLLTPESLSSYLAENGLIRDASRLRIHPLGGGVSNTVLLVEGDAVRWVAKQSLGKLLVKDDWRSDRRRILREADAIRCLGPKLDEGCLPKIIHVDEQHYFFIMTSAPADWTVWKESLLQGRVDLAVARQAGTLLGRLVKASRADHDAQRSFEDRTVFCQLRIDPYYRTTALRHPDVSEALGKLIEESWQVRAGLVHGDYSPKNMLIHGEKICLIDFECVHWGDPAFDSGFLLNHLMLKAFHQPRFQSAYLEAARQFWTILASELRPVELANFEPRTLRHLGGLMLARMDGKSPVEYIQAEETKARVRRAAKQILLERPEGLNEAFRIILRELV